MNYSSHAEVLTFIIIYLFDSDNITIGFRKIVNNNWNATYVIHLLCIRT